MAPTKSSAILMLIKYLLLVLRVKLIVINTILFTVKTCAISSTTGSPIIVSTSNTNTNSNQLNATNSHHNSVALSLAQKQLNLIVQEQKQPLGGQAQHSTQSDITDTYYGKCYECQLISSITLRV